MATMCVQQMESTAHVGMKIPHNELNSCIFDVGQIMSRVGNPLEALSEEPVSVCSRADAGTQNFNRAVELEHFANRQYSFSDPLLPFRLFESEKGCIAPDEPH